MRRYWFEFEFNDNDRTHGTQMGCGVTAYDSNDAMDLIRAKVFKNERLPKIKRILEDVDISSLEANHVLPNMLPSNLRGIWFPSGYK